MNEPLPGYDTWKLAEPPEGVYCGECEQAVYRARDPQEHKDWCPEHPDYDARRAKAAESLVRDLLKLYIDEQEDFAVVDAAFANNHVRGHIVNIPFWVSEPAIREML